MHHLVRWHCVVRHFCITDIKYIELENKRCCPPPTTPVCLKGPSNYKKCACIFFIFYCILFLINILAIPVNVKNEKYLTTYIIINV